MRLIKLLIRLFLSILGFIVLGLAFVFWLDGYIDPSDPIYSLHTTLLFFGLLIPSILIVVVKRLRH